MAWGVDKIRIHAEQFITNDYLAIKQEGLLLSWNRALKNKLQFKYYSKMYDDHHPKREKDECTPGAIVIYRAKP